MTPPTIEDAVAHQARLGIEEHLVWVSPTRFVIAHTDEERATINLVDCELHKWLMGELGSLPMPPGWFIVTKLEQPHDPTSQSFRSDAHNWDFEAVDVT